MALRTVDLIRAVRDGREPDAEAIAACIAGASSGTVPDYQLSALLMAIFHRGLSRPATAALTVAMRDSGRVLSSADVGPMAVDKHSTGGVGDKVSLHLAPWVASCGAAVPMVSGRGLGHTGGTIDKLASIPGFRHDLEVGQFVDLVRRNKVAMMGQSAEFAPADGKLYSLRDVTATVESIALITASILAKKLAEGIGALVLDVKVGSGAFMKTLPKARALATSIIEVGALCGLRVRAVLSDMQAPLGLTIGNALEVREAIAVLHGEGPKDVTELSLALGSEMLVLAERCPTLAAARAEMLAAQASKRAWRAFCHMVAAQGGDVAALEDGGRGLPRAKHVQTLFAAQSGIVQAIDAFVLGHISGALGAGRSRVDDVVDPGVGLELVATVGSHVAKGAPLVRVHHNGRLTEALALALGEAFVLGPVAHAPRPLVWDTL